MNTTTAPAALDFDDVVDNYLLAAVWTGLAERAPELDEVPEPLDDYVAYDELPADLVDAARADVAAFLASVTGDDLVAYLASHDGQCDMAAAQMGHDFSLNRNGHGAGFWDRDLGELGDRLSTIARNMGGATLFGVLDADGVLNFDTLSWG